MIIYKNTKINDLRTTVISPTGGDVTITECTSLSITAKNVLYNQTTTQINYIAICKGTQNGNTAQLRIDGVATSEDFGTNDTQANRNVTISFTLKNKTATTEITQKCYTPNNPDLLEYEWDSVNEEHSVIQINNDQRFTFTSSPVKVDLKTDLGINELTSTYNMFVGGNSKITKLISMPSTKNVTLMDGMFGWLSLTSLTVLDLSGWDVQNVNDMRDMFNNSSLITLDLSGWKLKENVDTTKMFSNCPNLTTIYMRNCDQPTIDKIKTALTDSGIPEGQVTIVTE